MPAQAETLPQPKYPLGSLVILDGGVVRVLGVERFVPSTAWFYLLGAESGEKKMIFHHRMPEWEIDWPDEGGTVIDMTKRRK